MKKLSIITICYNDPDLERTCKSIVEQTWQDFEWVVVDGASNEDTQKIWDKYKYRIDKFISEPDKGIYNAQNKGINLAEGEFLNFLNSGDSYYDKDVLKNIFENKTYKEDILYGNAYKIYGDNAKRNFVDYRPKKVDELYFICNYICTQAMFVQKELFNKYGIHNEDYKIASDRDLWIRFKKQGAKFKYLDKVVCNYDCNGLSSLNREKLVEELDIIIKANFTAKEIEKAKKNHFKKKNMPEYSLIERIFSIKKTRDEKHKIFMLFGIKIYVKIK